MLARACAAKTKSCFLKLAAPQLVQMFIGDGAKLVRDAFALAREKSSNGGGAIIFIDELDAIGTKRFDSDKSGDREVQRTMLELLNQLDGFSSDDRIKVIAATNRPDILDPALLRSGRLDRKVEFPLPDEEGRANIMRIHSNKMNVNFGTTHERRQAKGSEAALKRDAILTMPFVLSLTYRCVVSVLPSSPLSRERQLRGAGPLHRRLQRCDAEGRRGGGGYARTATRRD